MKIKIDFEQADMITAKSLKRLIRTFEDTSDIWETPDNRAADVAALYRVLKIYTTPGEYTEFVDSRHKKQK